MSTISATCGNTRFGSGDGSNLTESAPTPFALEVSARRLRKTEDEGLRARRLRRHEDRVRSVVARAVLRRLLAAHLRQAPHQLRFVSNRYGKPRLSDEAGIEFNVSHAGGFALIALELAFWTIIAIVEGFAIATTLEWLGKE